MYGLFSDVTLPSKYFRTFTSSPEGQTILFIYLSTIIFALNFWKMEEKLTNKQLLAYRPLQKQ